MIQSPEANVPYQENRFKNSKLWYNKNDRSAGARGGVAFLVKHGLVNNKEYRNTDFNIITDNEALVTDIDHSNNQNLILATIYCPNVNSNPWLFETTSNLSDNVMFVGEFNSKFKIVFHIISTASWFTRTFSGVNKL